MPAAEVIQLYVEPPGQAMERPARFLVGFQRLVLEPGQSERLSLAVPLRRLACFDEARDAFVLEGGSHRLVVARHAEDGGIGVVVELESGVIGP
jgi:beta-glucosidase